MDERQDMSIWPLLRPSTRALMQQRGMSLSHIVAIPREFATKRVSLTPRFAPLVAAHEYSAGGGLIIGWKRLHAYPLVAENPQGRPDRLKSRTSRCHTRNDIVLVLVRRALTDTSASILTHCAINATVALATPAAQEARRRYAPRQQGIFRHTDRVIHGQ